jgi:hypothetical protein
MIVSALGKSSCAKSRKASAAVSEHVSRGEKEIKEIS